MKNANNFRNVKKPPNSQFLKENVSASIIIAVCSHGSGITLQYLAHKVDNSRHILLQPEVVVVLE